MKRQHTPIFVSLVILAAFAACSGAKQGDSSAQPANSAENDIGIGPVTQKLELGSVDAGKATQGQSLFQAKCSACHKLDERYVGPALSGVTTRRRPEWILNQIMNPEEMTRTNPVAHDLLAEYLTQMTFQNVTLDEAKEILEYFRQHDAQTSK